MSLLRRRVMMAEQEEAMDNWEQIIDYTTEEDLTEKFIKLDDNGNPFRLKKAIISIKVLPMDGVTSAVDIDLNTQSINNSFWFNKRIHLTKCPTETEEYRRGYVWIEEILGKVHVINSLEGFNGSTVKDAMGAQKSVYGGFSIDDMMPALDGPITQINFGSYQKVMGAGTRIVVLGVRY